MAISLGILTQHFQLPTHMVAPKKKVLYLLIFLDGKGHVIFLTAYLSLLPSGNLT